MTGRDPLEYGWWLASRASGIVALALISLSVMLGLAMAGRVSRNPKLRRTMIAVHEQAALAGLIAIAVHAITLLGDRWLDPGVAGILVPFRMDHAPLYTGLSLEELLLRHALAAPGEAVSLPDRERQAAGALMLPIPRAGTLRAVHGRAAALAVPGVEEVTITLALGQPVVPLPEGDRYLGFVFARADTPAAVEAALRAAHARLSFVITAPGEPLDEAPALPAAPARRLLPIRG